MIARKMEVCLKKALFEYPVVTVFGPRQSGKTTLAKICCPDYDYITLEDRETRELAQNDYKALFRQHPAPLIIDEIQRVPELVSAVQVMVDAHRETCGQFILTGSQQSELAAAIDESLAGRTSVLDLYPLSLAELSAADRAMSADELILRGFMPELYRMRKSPTTYYRNYFRTYVERDVRRILNIKDIIRFERFVKLLAGRVGQVVNFLSLSDEVGVSGTTLSSWLAVLESSFLVYRLTPYYTNIAKRLVKSPKIYFADVGLAAYLLGLETPDQVNRDPLRGQLFENMVVMDALKTFANEGRDAPLAFYRTEKGFEIDLLVTQGRKVVPIEIKSSMTFSQSLVGNVSRFCADDPAAERPTLVYDGEPLSEYGPKHVRVANFRDNWLADDR